MKRIKVRLKRKTGILVTRYCYFVAPRVRVGSVSWIWLLRLSFSFSLIFWECKIKTQHILWNCVLKQLIVHRCILRPHNLSCTTCLYQDLIIYIIFSFPSLYVIFITKNNCSTENNYINFINNENNVSELLWK